jgi:anthranilate phosphoribosyltransferase
MTDSFNIPTLIRALGRGKKGTRDLLEEEAEFIMNQILNQHISGPQLGAFLMLMRVKEETAEELTGMVKACHRYIAYDAKFPIDVNWPAYAGKKKQPSWYILAAKLLSINGVKILIHGGGEHTAGRQYAREVCKTLNIPISKTLPEAEAVIRTGNIAYIAIEDVNDTLSNLIDMKAELGLRSPVNTLVRHVNPLNAKLTLQGMFHPAYMPLHHETSKHLKQMNNIVLKGDGGEFEVRPDSDTKIAIHANSPIFETTVPACLTQRSVRPETVTLQPLIDVWNGTSENIYGEAAIKQTASLVLSQLKEKPFSESQKLVESWWENRDTN